MKSYQNDQFRDKNERTHEAPVNDDGTYETYPVYRIPTEHLVYNFNNIRILQSFPIPDDKKNIWNNFNLTDEEIQFIKDNV